MNKLCINMDDLTKLRPCADSSSRVRALLRKLSSDKGHCFTAAEARAAGCTFDDIAWAASAIALKDKDVERRVRLFLADCAARVLPIFETRFPADDRPRRAIQAVRTWARDPSRAAWAAGAAGAAGAAWAARAAGAAEAAGAARAAWAAWAAGAAGAARAAEAAGAARAAEAAGAARAAWAAWAAERDWQFDRLILWLSDPEPKPLRLPARPKVESGR